MLHATLLAGLVLLQTVRLDPSDEVRKAVDHLAGAYLVADVAVLDSLIADPYLHVDGASGEVSGREEWLARVARRKADLDSGALVVDRYEVRDVMIRMRRDEASVTGIVVSEGTHDGVPFSDRMRFTNTWVREAGQWRRALFHDSPLP